MKETILEFFVMAFLGFGFVFAEKPILSLLSFLLSLAFSWIYILIEDRKERRIFYEL
ncbi:MAG: hypothetical protein J6S23_01595 [Clostridia bacterium]|nr:hypothetical protein [Clostridia bacterium]